MRTFLQALLISAFGLVAPDLHAAPRVGLFFAASYLCSGCAGSYSPEGFQAVVMSVYPETQLVTAIDAPTLRTQLAGLDALFLPYLRDNNLATAMTPEAIAVLRRFAADGGRVILKIPQLPDHLSVPSLAKAAFDATLPAFHYSGGGVQTTCDPHSMSQIGWAETPTVGNASFQSDYLEAAPANATALCAIGSDVYLAALPFGDGVVYFDGLFSNGVGDLSASQRQIMHQMVEADLVGPHRCFAAQGAVRCSGGNSFGQLGLGDKGPHSATYADLPVVSLGTGFDVARVTSASGTSCALSTPDGRLKCWGFNKSGQLGLGDVRPRGIAANELGDSLPPLDFGAGIAVRDVTVGGGHVCAVTSKDELRCWGRGASGQLGSGSGASVGDQTGATPVTVDLGTNAHPIQVRAGRTHTCALLTGGRVVCFGGNASGQLGVGHSHNIGDQTGSMGAALQPVDLGTSFVAVAIAAGNDHSCALSDEGRIKCWGLNDSGQLGQGVAVATRGTIPAELGDALPYTDLGEDQIATSLACGASHCCARLLENTMKCWGANDAGQLGLGDRIARGRAADDMGDQLPFVKLPPRERVAAIDLVGGTTCAQTDSGVRCWGANSMGQLATGDHSERGGTPDSVPRLLAPLY